MLSRPSLELESESDSGFTLVELLVVVAILGLIVGPLFLAFSSGLQASDTISHRLINATSRQLLASTFTADVQAVATDGLGDPALAGGGAPRDQVCPVDPAPSASEGTALFNLTPDPGSTSGPKVTYWALGDGEETRVVRAACDSGLSGETVVAEAFGEKGDSREDLVTGLVGQTYCDALRCALTFNGTFTYTLEIDRRVSGSNPSDLAPDKPKQVVATPLNGAANVRWAAPTTTVTRPTPTGYQVFTYQVTDTDNDGEYETSEETPLPALTTNPPLSGSTFEIQINGLTNGAHYRFRVQSLTDDAAGGIGTSGVVTPGLSAPSAPNPVLTKAGDGQITVSWGTPLNDGGAPIQSFTVSGSGGAGSVTFGTGSRALATRHTFTGLTNGTSYSFTVTATNSQGSTSASASGTPAGRPRPPADPITSDAVNTAVRFRGDDGTLGASSTGSLATLDGHALMLTVNGAYTPAQLAGGDRVRFWRLSAYAWGDLSNDPVVDVEAATGTANELVLLKDDPGTATAESAGIFNGTPYGVQVQACTKLTEVACNTDNAWSVPSSMGFREHMGSSLGTDPRVTDLLAAQPGLSVSDLRRTNYPGLAVPSGRPDAPTDLNIIEGLAHVAEFRSVPKGAKPNNGADIVDYRLSITRDFGRLVPMATVDYRRPVAVSAFPTLKLPGLDDASLPWVNLSASNKGEWYTTQPARWSAFVNTSSGTDGFEQFDVAPTGNQMGTYPLGGDLVSSRASRYSEQGLWGDTNVVGGGGGAGNNLKLRTFYESTSNPPKVTVQSARAIQLGLTGYQPAASGAYNAAAAGAARTMTTDGNGYWNLAMDRDRLLYGGSYTVNVAYDTTVTPTGSDQFQPVNVVLNVNADFDPLDATFVAPTGSDDNLVTGLDPSAPKASILQGMAKAFASSQNHVIVASGSYGRLDLTAASFGSTTTSAPLTITGGYDPTTWRRSVTSSRPTISGTQHGLLLDGAKVTAQQMFRQFTITSNNTGLTAADSTYGVRVVNGGKIAFTGVEIVAASPVARNATDLVANGSNGRAAPLGFQAANGASNGDNRPTGGAGAPANAGGSAGGNGGTGGYNSNGSAGTNGGGTNAGSGGGGGSKGTNGTFGGCYNADSGRGGTGGNGGAGGAAGAAGQAVVGSPGPVFAIPAAANGGAGTAGAIGAGGGGGGGGGGSSDPLFCNADTGGGGGGGGGGAENGTGGSAGLAGAGSFGIYAHGAGSQVVFTVLPVDDPGGIGKTLVTSGAGARGTNGGKGGNGGAAGSGGQGGGCNVNQENGAGGGGGGGGGGGAGAGGGGGAGGPSIALFLASGAVQTNALTAANATLVSGGGGAAGAGGAAGTAGPAGAAGVAGVGNDNPAFWDPFGSAGCISGYGGAAGGAGGPGPSAANGAAGLAGRVRDANGNVTP